MNPEFLEYDPNDEVTDADQEQVQKLIDEGKPVRIKRSSGEWQDAKIEGKKDKAYISVSWPHPEKSSERQRKDVFIKDLLSWQPQDESK